MKLRYHKKNKDFVDYDYVKKLSKKEQEWLQAFTNAYYCRPTRVQAAKAGFNDEQRRAALNRDSHAQKDIFTKGLRIEGSQE